MKTTNKITQVGFALGLAFALSACGGSSSSSKNNNGGNSDATSIGFLVDSAVVGVSYSTSSGQSGITVEDGKFNYLLGDTVTFTIGGLEIGRYKPTAENETVTPIELAEAASDDPLERETIKNNLLVFFQSLDTDGDPSNGISIAEGLTLAANSIDFTDPPEVFAVNPAFTDALPSGQTVVSLADAQVHFNEQQLKGSWLNAASNLQTNQVDIFTFDGTTFTHSGINPVDDYCGSGFEKGSYSVNAADAGKTAIEFDREREPFNSTFINPDCGVGDVEGVQSYEIVSVSSQILKLKNINSGSGDYGELITFNRIKNDGLKGTWLIDTAGSTLSLLDSGYYLVNNLLGEEYEEDVGVEYGQYTFTDTTFKRTKTLVHKEQGTANDSFGLADISGDIGYSLIKDGNNYKLKIIVPGEDDCSEFSYLGQTPGCQ